MPEAIAEIVAAFASTSTERTSTVFRLLEAFTFTDGPFAETKEQIGGFFLIEAPDFEEAIHIASKWPSARLGSIEVRPIEEELSMERRYG